MSLSTPNNDSSPLKTYIFNYWIVESVVLTIVIQPMRMLKTCRQVSTAQCQYSYLHMCRAIIRCEGLRGFYKGFWIVLLGGMCGEAIKFTTSKIRRKVSNTTSVEHDLPKRIILVGLANVVGVVASINVFHHLVHIPAELVSHRLMVQGNVGASNNNSENYKNALDVFRKIIRCDGPRGLYRGFWTSILLKMMTISIMGTSSSYIGRKLKKEKSNNTNEVSRFSNVYFWMSVAGASGVSTIVTTPIDTIRTRLQVLDAVDENGRRRPLTFRKTVQNLMNEGGVRACYKGFVPRWAIMFTTGAAISYSISKRICCCK